VEKLLPTGYITGIGFGKGKRSRPDDHQGYQGVEVAIDHDAVHDAFMMLNCHTNNRVVDISFDEVQCKKKGAFCYGIYNCSAGTN
jgi:hypothetical protein